MKNSILIFTVLFFSFSFSQNKINKEYAPTPKYPELYKTIPTINNNDPIWVKMLYSNSINFFELQKAYSKYYNTHPFKKSTHTQNFKYLSKTIRYQDYLQDDGSIVIPVNQNSNIKREKALKSRKNNQIASKSSAPFWEPVGPLDTFNPNGLSKQSSQTNIYTFSQSLTNPNVLFAGSETGGVFKSIDKGQNWFSVGDDFFNSGGIEVVEIDPTNEAIVYVASGRNLFKSIDGGVNWTTLLDVFSLQITAITVSPANNQVVLAAGNLGLRRSDDGGATWATVFADKCWDLRHKTDNANTIYLTKSNPTKNITEFLKSTDNGLTFTVKDTGWFSPTGNIAITNSGARIGVTNADANRVYVVLLGSDDSYAVDNNYIGIYRSDNAGESWTTPYDGNGDNNPDNDPGGPYSNNHWCLTSFDVDSGGYDQGFYNVDIEVSDTNADHFMIGALSLFKSEDGGTTYTKWGGYGCTGCGPEYRHPDHQELEFNNGDLWVCTDGGIDLYDGNLNFVESRNKGINGSDYWGLDQGWNYDVLVGGRYHNGNAAFYQTYGAGNFISLGGGEAPTGYLNKGENRKVHHSDIGGTLIPETLTGGISTIATLSMFSNEHYYINTRGEIVDNPNYWETIYLGKDHNLWKSENGGITFNLVKAFGTTATNLVKSIEVSRTNPNLIFATQNEGTIGKLWKTEDGGTTWVDVTIPANNQTMGVSLNANNELYLVLNNGGTNTNKVFKSIDLGLNWTNLTTATLDGEITEQVQVQEGTNGGVYLLSNKTVWYRNNTHADWQLFTTGLPLYFRTNKILPFYKEGKVRLAGTRGIWERDFFEPSQPLAQPFVAKKEVSCYQDEIQFEDFSVLNHTNASWQWNFPGSSNVNSTTIRNPKVTYPVYGSYNVTLQVTDANNNTNTKTINSMVTVSNTCQLSTTDSDGDGITDFVENTPCQNNIPTGTNLVIGAEAVVTNFNQATTGKHYITAELLTDCNNKTALVQATIDLDAQTINVQAYTHFDSMSTTDVITGNGTNEISSFDTTFAEIKLKLITNGTERQLVLEHISNACGNAAYIKLNQGCWSPLDYDNDNIPNYLDTDSDGDNILDQVEASPCTNTINQAAGIIPGNTTFLTNFNGATSGAFYVELNSYTICYGETAKLTAHINFEDNSIRPITYKHFGSAATNDPINGYGTNQVESGSNLYATIGYRLEDTGGGTKQLVFLHLQNACGNNVTARVNQSCWGNLDSDSNGFVDFLDNPTLSTSQVSSASINTFAYPNPISNSETLHFSNLNEAHTFKLYTIQGKQIDNVSLKIGETYQINNLATGMYIYMVETSSRLFSGKIIVK
ncbi:MAG: T9SS type A sorting domain-containing protein [Oceanihabitans sp.]